MLNAEKSFRIKHEDSRFLSRLISKEASNGNTSSRVFYYGDKSVAVPFIWEAQPGTPKHPLSDTSLPPLTPPPSYFTSNSNAKRRNSRKGSNNNNNNNNSSVISIIWPRFGRKAHVSPTSTTTSWSSLLSSSLSSSSSSLPHSASPSHSRSHSSSSTLMGSPMKHKCCSHGLIRGCYPFGNMKNATV